MGSTRDKNGKMRDWLVEAEKKREIIFQRYENIIKQRIKEKDQHRKTMNEKINLQLMEIVIIL